MKRKWSDVESTIESCGELQRAWWKVEPPAPAMSADKERAVDQLHERAIENAIAHRVGYGSVGV